MDKELAVVLGMSLSYAASLAGMFIGMWAYKRNARRKKGRPSMRGPEPADSTRKETHGQ
jgi:hypothetical protein